MNNDDLVNLVKLSLSGNETDIRLYAARLVRRLKKTDLVTSNSIEKLLKANSTRGNEALRRTTPNHSMAPVPQADAGNALIKTGLDCGSITPILSDDIKSSFEQLIREREASEVLAKANLKPTSSVIFQGPPGVGKTLSANWLAHQLKLPFYTLDLTVVMSSLLGKTGANLRSVIDYAKTHPCVLFLDEFDAIAKKRNDESDVGELKRLVTVMLQEIENWPAQGLLIAATNHSELVDPALWRRFDLEIEFSLPSYAQVRAAVEVFLSSDIEYFSSWLDIISLLMVGRSYSDINRLVMKLRKSRILSPTAHIDLMLTPLLQDHISKLGKAQRIEFGLTLISKLGMSRLKASKLVEVSRDTLRKHERK